LAGLLALTIIDFLAIISPLFIQITEGDLNENVLLFFNNRPLAVVEETMIS
jgi:hypothetical protein